MILRTAVGLAAGLLLAAAGPPPPGASGCSGCHGGVASPPDLTGRKAADITAALTGFRSGERPATVMNRIAKGFTPDESAAIAAWWEAQR